MTKRSARPEVIALSTFLSAFAAISGVGGKVTADAGSSPSENADGTYTAIGEYGDQPSQITVTVTLEEGIIRSVQVEPHASVPRSLELQRAFAAAVPAVVVGRPIGEVNVGKLAGSSGTPVGFNDAIRQIREQAANED